MDGENTNFCCNNASVNSGRDGIVQEFRLCSV